MRKHRNINLVMKKKKEETIWCQDQIIKAFHRKSLANINEKNSSTYE